MPTVYVPHKPDQTVNYDSAKTYGDVRILFEGPVPVHSRKIMEKFVKEGLKDFAPDDYVILGGNHFIMAVTLGVVLGRHGKVKVLQFNKRDQGYDVYELGLDLGRG